MNKSILAIAVAATMAAPAAVMAAPTVYGNVHLSLNAADNDVVGADNNLKISSNTSAIGVKGSEDLGDGLKAIYKVEFGIGIGSGADTTPDNATNLGNGGEGKAVGALSGRDQFVGLKGGWGSVKFVTMSSNYKQMGGKVDPLYRTPLEARGFLNMQSPLHSGKGINRGRSTHTAQYVSPKMAGVQLVANTTFSGSNDETSGIGLRWSNKAFLVYGDWINFQIADPNLDVVIQDCTVANLCDTATAIKLGGKFSAKAFALALQYETIDTGEWQSDTDYIFAAGTWNINKNNALILTAGQTSVDVASGEDSVDSTGVALAYNHKMSKLTNVYVGYGALSSDEPGDPAPQAEGQRTSYDESMLTFGIRKKF